jgi:hypothetical protein
LKNQITAIGAIPILEVVTLEQAKANLTSVAKQMQEGNENLQNEFEQWVRISQIQPKQDKRS